MSDNDGQDPKSAPAPAPETSKDVGPVGRTRSEEQRRRLIITGIATPALMTLPSRRVWAAKCTKSKLLSGNLSAKKKKGAQQSLDCDPMGCKKGFWKDHPTVRDIDWSTWEFEGSLNPGALDELKVYADSDTIFAVVDGLEPPNSSNWLSHNAIEPYYDNILGELKKCAEEAAAAYLNAYFISWPAPNNAFNFELTTTEVSDYWKDVAALAWDGALAAVAEEQAKADNDDAAEKPAEDLKEEKKDAIKDIKDILKAANESNKSCPF